MISPQPVPSRFDVATIASSAETPTVEHVLQTLQDELIACQRLAVLGNLSAMAAHEFNNLMTPVIARVEAALSTPDDVPFMRKALERTQIQAQRAIQLSRHLLDMAHDGYSVSRAPCNLLRIVREALETATRPLEKDNIKLDLRVAESIVVRGSEDLLIQVVLNLVLNAREAMKPQGGSLRIEASDEGENVRLVVADSGRGMPPEFIQGVLNPFLAADPLRRANDWHRVGLGLSVCRMIAHRHGARIEAASGNPGCIFTVRWPSSLAASV